MSDNDTPQKRKWTLSLPECAAVVTAIFLSVGFGYGYGKDSQSSLVKAIERQLEMTNKELDSIRQENTALKLNLDRNFTGINNNKLADGAVPPSLASEYMPQRFYATRGVSSHIDDTNISITFLSSHYGKNDDGKKSDTNNFYVDISIYEPGSGAKTFENLSVGSLIRYGDYELFIDSILIQSVGGIVTKIDKNRMKNN